LLNSLGLYSQLSEDIYHLVCVPSIPAETVPFKGKHIVCLSLMAAQLDEVFFPGRPVKGLGGMVLIDDMADGNSLHFTIAAKKFFLPSLGVPFVGLFVRGYPHIQVCNFHNDKIL
jgi:hypothetical protein